MPIRTNELVQRLTGKFGFAEAPTKETGHKWYELRLKDLPVIRTKVSHGIKEYGSTLEGKVAKQLRVRGPFFNQMMSCTKSRDEYYQQVHTDPFPPWSVHP